MRGIINDSNNRLHYSLRVAPHILHATGAPPPVAATSRLRSAAAEGSHALSLGGALHSNLRADVLRRLPAGALSEGGPALRRRQAVASLGPQARREPRAASRDQVKFLSQMFKNSSEKSSMSAAKCFTRVVK